ncbi:hypothetical protein HPB51_003726 [Rhipicephalus microplus]|uniref:Uncharacterized protein n=1 Tax=Rhipicephalus microplus TaxID=6941 RepID=A0A9J6ELG6_RHIMP|nr:hypothetical protein HPB51_003726 [Rhipicephalus microplus]
MGEKIKRRLKNRCRERFIAGGTRTPEHLDACKKGCRNFVEAGFHAVTHDMNATHAACFNACSEAYPSQPSYYACTGGCDEQFRHVSKMSEQKKTSHLHPLKLLMLVQKMYETVVDHVCRIIRRTFYAVYVQKDTGHLVVVRGELTPIRILDPHAGDPAEDKPAKPASSTKSEQEAADGEASSTVSAAATSSSFSWLDCISRQSGIPEWLLVMVLFLVVVTMVWLCCATMVSSPSSSVTSTSPPPAYSHHLAIRELMRCRNSATLSMMHVEVTSNLSQQKMGVSGDLDYLLIYDPSEQVKIQPPVDQEAPPLPVKVPLSQI